MSSRSLFSHGYYLINTIYGFGRLSSTTLYTIIIAIVTTDLEKNTEKKAILL